MDFVLISIGAMTFGVLLTSPIGAMMLYVMYAEHEQRTTGTEYRLIRLVAQVRAAK